MRIRSIKPEFWVSESIGRLSREARLLFIGLWSFAEDSGRGRGAFPAISGALFPYDQDAVKLIPKWFAELEREGMVRRYQAEDGNTYYDMPNWLKHQKIEKPSKTRLPEFVEGSPNTPRILPEMSGEEQGAGSREPVAGSQEVGSGDCADSSAPAAPPTDQQWIESLRSQKAYEGIDVVREVAKCKVWSDTNRKQFSRRRVINWLNRIDKPLSTTNGHKLSTDEILGLKTQIRSLRGYNTSDPKERAGYESQAVALIAKLAASGEVYP